MRQNGISWEGEGIYVTGLSWMNKVSPVDTYICTSCGYFESYVSGKEILQKITASEKWRKVN